MIGLHEFYNIVSQMLVTSPLLLQFLWVWILRVNSIIYGRHKSKWRDRVSKYPDLCKKKRTKCEATAVFCLLRQRSSKYDVIEPKIKTTIASGIHKIVFDIFVDSQIIFNIKLHWEVLNKTKKVFCLRLLRFFYFFSYFSCVFFFVISIHFL